MDMVDPTTLDPDTSRLLAARRARWTEQYRAKVQMQKIAESANRRRPQLSELRAEIRSHLAVVPSEPSPELRPILEEIEPPMPQDVPPVATLTAYYVEEVQLADPLKVITSSTDHPDGPFRGSVGVGPGDAATALVDSKTVFISWLFAFTPGESRVYSFFPTAMGYGYCYASPEDLGSQPPFSESYGTAQLTFSSNFLSDTGALHFARDSRNLAPHPGDNDFWFGRPADGVHFMPFVQLSYAAQLAANSPTILTAGYIINVTRRGNGSAFCDFEGSSPLGPLELGPVWCYVY
jgi:hypothetical protein